mmetsp:Transcript_61421/g.174443  ORF Transcript_61421/g.174443 Transcript_61421/m.174443 type:complete len:347 (+) Transcript_61421:186-1226(+)
MRPTARVNSGGGGATYIVDVSGTSNQRSRFGYHILHDVGFVLPFLLLHPPEPLFPFLLCLLHVLLVDRLELVDVLGGARSRSQRQRVRERELVVPPHGLEQHRNVELLRHSVQQGDVRHTVLAGQLLCDLHPRRPLQSAQVQQGDALAGAVPLGLGVALHGGHGADGQGRSTAVAGDPAQLAYRGQEAWGGLDAELARHVQRAHVFDPAIDRRAEAGEDPAVLVGPLAAHIIPGTMIVRAGVGALSRGGVKPQVMEVPRLQIFHICDAGRHVCTIAIFWPEDTPSNPAGTEVDATAHATPGRTQGFARMPVVRGHPSCLTIKPHHRILMAAQGCANIPMVPRAEAP